MADTQTRETQATPLADVDVNRQIEQPQVCVAGSPEKEPARPAPSFSLESKQHRGLHARILAQEKTGKQTGHYVSPSDDIMSPASAKLNALKQKRLQKVVAKPRTLFAMRPDSSHSQS